MRVLIVGAGIAGLSLALALSRRGLTPRVIERRAQLTAAGAGIVLGPNHMTILASLGLAEAAQSSGRPLRRGIIARHDGRILARNDLALPGLPTPVAIHRAALQRLLLAALPTPPETGLHPTHLDLAGDHPRVTLSDASTSEWDLVVGADGIRSAVRPWINPAAPEPRYAGYTCWRAVVPGTPTDEVWELWGPGRRLGVVPLGDDATYLFRSEDVCRERV